MNFRKLELEDQPWFPGLVKEGMTDYLRFLFQLFDLYKPVFPLLLHVLKKSNAGSIIDLCSGSGGAVEKLMVYLHKEHNNSVPIVLTDICPRKDAWQYLAQRSGKISFVPYPVDAASVSAALRGFRVMFSGIHHFSEEGVKNVIGSAVRAKEGIAIFDGGDKHILMILAIVIFHPLALLFFTPFIAPFRWWRLLFTYLLPLIPLGVVWDGIVSVLNLYTPKKLLEIAQSATTVPYEWKAGKVRNRFGMGIAYLTGVPVEKV